MILLSTLFCLQYIATVWSFDQLVTLNTSQLTTSGARLSVTDNIDSTYGYWHITPQTQSGADLQILLNEQYGFHESINSTIKLIIHGFTPNITKSDGEFFILFAVNDRQYFSTSISLNKNQSWKSYPKSENATLATNNNISRNIISPNTPDRTNRISNNGSWTHIGQISYKHKLQWPLHIQITNDPIHNLTHYRCTLSNITLNAVFTTSFDTNKGMNIYIMNNGNHTPFNIYSIDITYSYFSQQPVTPSLSRYPRTTPVQDRRVDEGLQTSMTEHVTRNKETSAHSDNSNFWTSSWMKIAAIAAAICFLCCISAVFIKIFVTKCIKKKDDKKPMKISKPTLNTLPIQAQIMTYTGTLSNNVGHHLVPTQTDILGLEINAEEQGILSSGDELFETHVTRRIMSKLSIADAIPLKDSDNENED